MLTAKYFPGLSDYSTAWQAMQRFTEKRHANPQQFNDEIWLMEHPPVFTQGLAGKPEHILNPHDIPVIQCDRGGQVTYHGPGQLMLYTLIDLNQKKINTRCFVRKLEQVLMTYLTSLNITADYKVDAPGVYVGDAKIASIGLRVRHGLVYHGLAFNVDMDLTPFRYINPCGYKALAITQLRDLSSAPINTVREAIIATFSAEFGYNGWQTVTSTLRDLIT